MSPTQRINDFLSVAGTRFSTHDSDIARRLSHVLMHPYSDAPQVTAARVPASTKVPELLADTQDELLHRLADCANDLHWRQAGFGQLPIEIGHRIAVVEILGPSGMFKRHDFRFGLLIQCESVCYPKHSHTAEELYLVLKGVADWTVGAGLPMPKVPGTFVHHHSLEPHSITTHSEPLLTLWGWAGDINAASYSI